MRMVAWFKIRMYDKYADEEAIIRRLVILKEENLITKEIEQAEVPSKVKLNKVVFRSFYDRFPNKNPS